MVLNTGSHLILNGFFNQKKYLNRIIPNYFWKKYFRRAICELDKKWMTRWFKFLITWASLLIHKAKDRYFTCQFSQRIFGLHTIKYRHFFNQPLIRILSSWGLATAGLFTINSIGSSDEDHVFLLVWTFPCSSSCLSGRLNF